MANRMMRTLRPYHLVAQEIKYCILQNPGPIRQDKSYRKELDTSTDPVLTVELVACAIAQHPTHDTVVKATEVLYGAIEGTYIEKYINVREMIAEQEHLNLLFEGVCATRLQAFIRARLDRAKAQRMLTAIRLEAARLEDPDYVFV